MLLKPKRFKRAFKHAVRKGVKPFPFEQRVVVVQCGVQQVCWLVGMRKVQ